MGSIIFQSLNCKKVKNNVKINNNHIKEQIKETQQKSNLESEQYFNPDEIKFLDQQFKEKFQLFKDIDDANSISNDEKYIKPKQRIRWKEGQVIGMGSFGRVIQAMNRDNGEIMAIKQFHIGNNSEIKLKSMQAEIEVLSQLKHKNIVRYIGCTKSKDYLNIILEYCSDGSLFQLLNKYGPLSEVIIRQFTTHILEGLQYLHYKNIVHRDIKCANVLVSNGICKLSDFGSSKQLIGLQDDHNLNTLTGTSYWMSPEMIKESGHGRFADIWSLGCTVLEMATAKHPWSELNNPYTALYVIAQSQSPPKIPSTLSNSLQDFMKNCLEIKPSMRFNVIKLLQHKFITGIVDPQLNFCRSKNDNLNTQSSNESNQQTIQQPPEHENLEYEDFEEKYIFNQFQNNSDNEPINIQILDLIVNQQNNKFGIRP